MSRKTWLATALTAIIAVTLATGVALARRATDDRSRYATRGLDYLHARQTATGGFGSAEGTAWSIIGSVASGERMSNRAWRISDKTPYSFLQATDLAAASAGAEANNVPVYYSRLILSYVAMDKAGALGTAGSKRINLLSQLLSYQNTTDGSPTKGAFAPSLPSIDGAVRSTSWAILAMHNAGVSHSDPRYLMAAAWLAAQQNTQTGGDGGFASSQRGAASNALDTALAYQALLVSSNGSDWRPSAARAFLQAAQRANAGFPSSPGGDTDAEATAAVIQAIIAMGEHPGGGDWLVGDVSPLNALNRLQQDNGSYRLTARTRLRPIGATGWALTALGRKPFTTYPRNLGRAHTAFKFRPELRTASPKNGTKLTKTRSVLIRATYTDRAPNGTGIKTSASHVYVDGANKSRPADIGSTSLRLQLKNVPNGEHRYKIELRDYAGNVKTIERTFTVAVPTPTPSAQPESRPTYSAPVAPSYTPTRPSTPRPYTTPPPLETPTPLYTETPGSPYPSVPASPVVSGSPIPSPSGSPTGRGDDGQGGAGFVGGTLLAMLPVGATLSYLLLHRREEFLESAMHGEVLDGGGSAWERFKRLLADSRDLTRPSSRG